MIRSIMRASFNSRTVNDFEWNYNSGEEKELHNREIGAALICLYVTGKADHFPKDYLKSLDKQTKLKK